MTMTPPYASVAVQQPALVTFDVAEAIPSVRRRAPRWLTFVADLQMTPRTRFDLSAVIGILLTMSKVPLAGVLVAASIAGFFEVTAYLVGAFVVVDIFDGVVFRRSGLGESARLVASRAVFDAHVDRVALVGTLIPLFLLHDLPSGFLVIVLIREAYLMYMHGLPFYWRNTLFKPNLLSRIATSLVGVGTIVFCAGLPYLDEIAIGFVAFAIAGIAHHYVRPELAQDQSV